jgi:hypothetical protein
MYCANLNVAGLPSRKVVGLDRPERREAWLDRHHLSAGGDLVGGLP